MLSKIFNHFSLNTVFSLLFYRAKSDLSDILNQPFVRVVKFLNLLLWRSLIEELDGIGVPINKTLTNLVKMYSEEEVKEAIALLKIRKRDKHIPNPGGYFTSALKGNWAGSNLDSEEDTGCNRSFPPKKAEEN